MFKPVDLLRVDIYVLKTYVSRVTWALARMRLVHLVDVHASVAEQRLASAIMPVDQTVQGFANIIERAKQLMELIGARYQPLAVRCDVFSEDELGGFDQQLDSLEQTLSALASQARRLTELAMSASRAARLLKILEEANTDPAVLARSGRLAVRIGILPPGEVSVVEQKLASTPHFFQQQGEIEDGIAVLVATTAGDRDRMDEALRQSQFVEVGPPEQAIREAAESAEKSAQQVNAELNTVHETLRRASVQAEIPLATIRRKAEIALGLAKARQSFGTVGHTMIISGWVPKEKIDEVRQAVQDHAPAAAYIEVVDPGDVRRVAGGLTAVPVLFNNPLLLKPFERIATAYDTPRYGEVEPTAFLAVSFLVMFGVMFGDVGQGLLLALTGYFIFRMSYRYTDAGVLLMECGTVSALFGILYGSVFGTENLIPALWFSPMRDISTSIAVSLAFGAALISIGVLLNVVNSVRSREASAAIFGEHGLVGAFMYWVCLAIGTKFLLTGEVGLTGSALTLLIGLPALTILFRRPIEEIFRRWHTAQPAWREMPSIFVESLIDLGDAFLSYLANTVSFIRLSAFSLAHIGLFAAVFALAESLSRVRGGGMWYWIALIVGNLVIVLLEGMIASIQAIRLEYYELFSKFFKGGGEAFRPLQV